MRTHVMILAAAQLLLIVPAIGAQQPARTPQQPAERRAPRPERLPRAEPGVERRAIDTLSACRCSTGDVGVWAGTPGELRALRQRGMARSREALRRFLDTDSLGRSGRMRVLLGRAGAPGEMGRIFQFARPDPDRAAVGVLLGDASTGGIEVVDVTTGGPAERAGIRAGDRLTAVDGTSLRVVPADSVDPVLVDAVARRLTRHLDSLTAGDTIVLRVAGSGGAERDVPVATVRADELAPAGEAAGAMAARMARSFGAPSGSAAIGLTARATGTPRDTLGVFVSAVVPGGRADRAGIHEGMRIVSVNGTDLRVDPADAGDRAVAVARAARLDRIIADAGADGVLTVRVLDGERIRELRVE
ncbi:MAG: PDZ domain-containing protein [Gemmatimonadaceae bacterium]